MTQSVHNAVEPLCIFNWASFEQWTRKISVLSTMDNVMKLGII